MVYLGDKCLIPTECPASREGREKGEKKGSKKNQNTGLNLHWYPLGIHSEGISQERCRFSLENLSEILPVTGSETLFKGGRVTWCWWSLVGCMMTSQANYLMASRLLEKLKFTLELSSTWQQCLRWLWVLQLLGFQVLGVFWVWLGRSSCRILLLLANADKACHCMGN